MILKLYFHDGREAIHTCNSFKYSNGFIHIYTTQCTLFTLANKIKSLDFLL